jgi:hypothetical protein
MFRSLLILGIALLVSFRAASAQSTLPPPKFTLQGGPEQADALWMKDSLGRPCLDIEAAARPHVVDPQVLDHVVSVKSNCSRLFKIKVCYYGSDRCVPMDISAYKRVDAVLGTMKGISSFRYSVLQR